MTFRDLLKYVQCEKVFGNTEVEIEGLCAKSSHVKRGDLFFCYKGLERDSHEFAEKACTSGAVALICEREINTPLPYAVVKDGRAAMRALSRAYYGFPDERLKIVAVTGTNGKTTTTYMLKSIFDENCDKTGVIGTLGVLYGDRFISPELTTPDPIFLYSIFRDMADCGVRYVFMEASAHALYLGKLDGITFEVGIFTNLTQDHLDFFKDMKSYGKAKEKLFGSGRCKIAVINSDDKFGAKLLEKVRNPLSYGLENPADVFAIDIAEDCGGSSFVINLFDELYDVKLNLTALHNVYNALAAATCASALGVKLSTIAKGLSALKGVTGRLERVATYNGGTVFVDFAHTPDGLEKSLSALKGICEGDLLCMFGCGGNRDKTKRPIMGEISAKYADFTIITSDNPRYEDAYDIISEIEKGLIKGGGRYVAISERESATEYALNLLSEGDILLVAGKGGENYQEIMGIKHSYNDNTVIKKIIGRT